MDIVDALKEDYRKFPKDQNFNLYAEDLYFKDPLNKFRGRALFKLLINFMSIFFLDCVFDVHQIQRRGDEIRTDWTLSWTTPLPWKPRIHIPGWSELKVNAEELIVSQIDYWRCSRLDLLKQHFPWFYKQSVLDEKHPTHPDV
ncbi:DUF2358 domain-containing protein [Phormidium tenue FACHB-886]|nr:DUF2358 domain-containing protein [Phormidium tenue FACHB-886]